MEILIVKTSAIGDVTHTLPALNALRKKYPEARITWLVEEAAADVVRGHKSLDRLLVSGRKRWTKELCGRKFFSTLREVSGFIRELRDTRYDLLIDFQGLLKSGIFVALTRAERKVGFGRGMEHAECSWLFLNERIPAVNMNIHALDRELLLLKAIGVECNEVRFDFPIGEKDTQRVAEILRAAGIGPEDSLIAINPHATWPTKLWDNDKFASLARSLVDKKIKVVFTGGPSEEPEIDDLISRFGIKAMNLAGKTSLKELAALYQRAKILITTDTGPMHIAAAVGTPVAAVFGPTAPWRTGPYGRGHRILRSKIECSPCLKKDCVDKQCMQRISTEQVLEAVDQILCDNQK
ncbi:MAG: lipopolysaccharide heptosyltransferase I [Proteobacteria bacterium]|nr:lipopolysaccharide heptosyltransferase I [Pseudomonadota bacterium]MBU1739816.1 lipopolysaccharide heptosyltransferase I [Pseudomonadota bacterium]